MKINLGLEEPKMIKTFSFDIDEEYEQTTIGERYYGTIDPYDNTRPKEEETKEEKKEEKEDKDKSKEEKIEVPDFVGLSYKEAKALADQYNLYLNASPEKESDKVIEQDTKAGTEVEKGVTIKLTFEETSTTVEEPETKEENNSTEETNKTEEKEDSTEEKDNNDSSLDNNE